MKNNTAAMSSLELGYNEYEVVNYKERLEYYVIEGTTLVPKEAHSAACRHNRRCRVYNTAGKVRMEPCTLALMMERITIKAANAAFIAMAIFLAAAVCLDLSLLATSAGSLFTFVIAYFCISCRIMANLRKRKSTLSDIWN